MGLRETLELLVTMDPSQGVKGLDTFAKKSEETSKRVGDNLSKIGASALKLGAAGLGAGLFLTAMADADKQSLASLKASIEQTGGSYDDFANRIDDTISKQAKFAHTDGEVTTALGILTTAYGDTGKAIDRMQLVADLAAKKHISLAAAADLVAKVHDGSTKALKGFDIQIGVNTDGTKDYEGALDQLSGKVDGQAKASVTGLTGFLQVLRAEVENQVSAFGEKYGPAISLVSAAVTAFGGIATGVSAIMAKVTAAHLATAAAAQAQAAAEAAAAERLVTANSAATVASLYAVEGATVASGAAFGPWGIAVAAGILAASTAIDIWGGKTEYELAQVSALAQSSGKDLVESFDFTKNEGNPGDFAKQLDLLVSSGTTGIGVLQRYRDELVAEGRDTSAVDDALRRVKEAQDNANDATKTGTEVVGGYTAALKALDDQIHGAIDPVFGFERALIANRKAQEDATTAMTDGKHSADEVTSANINAAESALAVKDAADKLSGAIADGSVKLNEVNGYLAGFVAQGLLTQAQADAIAASVNSIPGEKTVSVYADTAQAEGALARVSASLGHIIGGVFGLHSIGLSLPGNAAGTDNWRGGPTWVGEDGPEILNLPRGSQIIPNNRAMGSGSSTGTQGPSGPLVIQLVLDKKVIHEVAIDGMASNARRNGNALASSISRG
jgi:hypothetical protein